MKKPPHLVAVDREAVKLISIQLKKPANPTVNAGSPSNLAVWVSDLFDMTHLYELLERRVVRAPALTL